MRLEIYETADEEELGKYHILAMYEWLIEPICRFTDYFAVTIHQGLVIIPGTEYALQQYDSVDPWNSITTHTISGSIVASGVGGHCMSVYMPPVSSGDLGYCNFRGLLSYDVKVAEQPANGELDVAIYVTYGHHILVPSFSVGFTLSQGGYASITPTASFEYMNAQKNFTYQE